MTKFPSVNPEMISIEFDTADISFDLANNEAIVHWLKKVIEIESGNVSRLNYVFCSDEYLHDLNVRYLNHDTLTDIITFPIEENPIESEIYISIERVRENSGVHSVSFEQELNRVMIHGLLHLLGYTDKGAAKKEMRQMEDKYIGIFRV